MSLLVPPETVLQRFVHDVLHASVRRRVHVDPSLQKSSTLRSVWRALNS